MCRWEDGKTLKYEKDSVSLASLGYKEGMSLTYKVGSVQIMYIGVEGFY